MNWTAYLFASPLNWLSGALVVLDIALAVYYAVKLSSSKHREQLTGMEHGINIMLPTSCGMLFFALLDPLVSAIRASFSIGHAQTRDPWVLLDGLIRATVPIMFYGALCLFFLIVWYFLRVVQRRRLEQLK